MMTSTMLVNFPFSATMILSGDTPATAALLNSSSLPAVVDASFWISRRSRARRAVSPGGHPLKILQASDAVLVCGGHHQSHWRTNFPRTFCPCHQRCRRFPIGQTATEFRQWSDQAHFLSSTSCDQIRRRSTRSARVSVKPKRAKRKILVNQREERQKDSQPGWSVR
jgi:hypothetical protein